DESRRRRSSTAVVPDLQEIGSERARAGANERAFLRPLGIADQERGAAPEGNANDERVVVWVGERDPVGARGQDFDQRASVGPRTTAERARTHHGDASGTKPRDELRVPLSGSLALPLPGIPELANSDVCEPGRQAAEMIRVGVGQDGDRDARTAA